MQMSVKLQHHSTWGTGKTKIPAQVTNYTEAHLQVLNLQANT